MDPYEQGNATYLYFSGCWLFHPRNRAPLISSELHVRMELGLKHSRHWDVSLIVIVRMWPFQKMMSTSGLWSFCVFFVKGLFVSFRVGRKNISSATGFLSVAACKNSHVVGILGYPWRSKVIHNLAHVQDTLPTTSSDDAENPWKP